MGGWVVCLSCVLYASIYRVPPFPFLIHPPIQTNRGFSQLRGIKDFSVEAKRAYLYGFWTDVLNKKPMVLIGASLGGAAAVDFAHAYPEAVSKLVLIDAQVGG